MNYTFTGRVLNLDTKETVDGAKITLELDGKSQVVHSDSEGFYHFQAILTQDSTLARIRLEAQGYKQYNRNINLSKKDNKIEEIHLTPIKEIQNSHSHKIGKVAGISTTVATILGTVIAVAQFLSQPQNPQKNLQVASIQECDPAYPGICIPKNSPDLKCSDIKHRKFQVLKPDPHGFDRDKNGIGCEK